MKCPAVPGSCMPPPHGHARAGTGAAGASRARYDPRGEREEGVHAGAAGPSLSEMRGTAHSSAAVGGEAAALPVHRAMLSIHI